VYGDSPSLTAGIGGGITFIDLEGDMFLTSFRTRKNAFGMICTFFSACPMVRPTIPAPTMRTGWEAMLRSVYAACEEEFLCRGIISVLSWLVIRSVGPSHR
jgi:hypothetical protein